MTTSKFTTKLLLLSHSEIYTKLTIVVVSHKILLVRLFCAPLPAAPGGNCSPLSRLSYATVFIGLYVLFSAVITRCKVCFREVEGSSQCQGARDTCSDWSSSGMGVNETHPAWSEEFRDDTDNQRGGCTYQWRLICE